MKPVIQQESTGCAIASTAALAGASYSEAKKVANAILSLVLLTSLSSAFAGNPDCAGIERWATKSAFAHLKNAGITNNRKLDFAKTKTTRLASEKVGKGLYRQIHFITFTEKSGGKIKVITSNEASNEECSISSVTVYVISKELEN